MTIPSSRLYNLLVTPYRNLVRVSSLGPKSCPFCEKHELTMDDLESASEHLYGHGLDCIHVGPEDYKAHSATPVRTTVAVFAKQVK